MNQGRRIEKPFDKQIVRRMLENDVHLGHVVWGVVGTEKAHPKIIELEQFQRVSHPS